ncbi:MAG: PAS domain-containing protein [Candidatus Marinimicrobia bacterium]|nr:PAS domain-containing protein [Candidatus Neomarinimicrobiota bacterium]
MKTPVKKETNLRSTLSAQTVLIVSFILLILYTGFAGFEYHRSKDDLISMMEEEGYLLLDALMISSERSILEYKEMAFSDLKNTGPGALIKRIMQRRGIAYIVLQDDYGVLMASENLPDLDQILEDPFLLQISIEKTKGSRLLETDTDKVFEIAGAFFFQDEYIGIFRIGLEMDQYQRILQTTRVRFILTAIIFLFVGLIGFSFTVVKQNTRLLSESYQRVKTYTGEILQNLKDAVIAADHTGIITVFNVAAAELMEIPADKIIGKSIFNLKIPCLEPIIETLQTENTIFNHRKSITVKGKRKILSIGTSIVRNHSGSIETVILIATDLTLQNHLEEQLQRQEKLTAMGELASGVAHEIRNPINAIGMIAQRLSKEFQPREDDTEYHELTSSIVHETKRIDQSIRQFLSFTRPAVLQKQPTDMTIFLNKLGQFFRSSSKAKGVHFSLQIKGAGYLAIDPAQLQQALLNLLQNSLDATPKDGQILLSSQITENQYEICVSDTGQGIPDQNRNKIFDIYFTTKRDGTGMGLPIVHQIIQQHNGKILVEPNEEQGTIFRILLPLEEA